MMPGTAHDDDVDDDLGQLYPELQDIISLTQNVQTISQQMSEEKELKERAAAKAMMAAVQSAQIMTGANTLSGQKQADTERILARHPALLQPQP
mgnify:CR=1 FL=1